MDMSKIMGGIVGLFFITVLYYVGDPIVSGQLYTMGTEGHAEIAANYLTAWRKVAPVFAIACILIIIQGGRQEDLPSSYYMR